ncbi:MAG: 4-hydroxy-tetrahydrodipicolinate synthase [Verrucomicrobiales bacterium]|jgi:4-hydroxy-tetrahydrodipicolinate synthase
MFEGAHTALITPFNADREVDEAAFRALIDEQFDNGISGIVPVGTTGESPTLNNKEHRRVINIAVDQAAGRGHVIAGTGSNSTREAVTMTKFAEDSGATASLQVCPYYNKPSQEGLFQHYKAIAEATKLPIILYSIPGRSVIEITVETQQRLHEACPNICAMKEAGGDGRRIDEIHAALPAGYETLSGDDALTIDFMQRGAKGVISVAGNLIPRGMSDLVAAMASGDTDTAKKIDAQFSPLFNAFLKLDTNPVPIKEAMALAGKCSPLLRLPMVPLTDEKRAELKATLEQLHLL